MVKILASMKDRLICFLYHKDITPEDMELMEKIRQEYVNLAMFLAKTLPECRSKSLSLTHLEEAQFRSIQALALQGTPQCEEYYCFLISSSFLLG